MEGCKRKYVHWLSIIWGSQDWSIFMVVLISLKACEGSTSQLIVALFLSIFEMGLLISAKFVTYLLRKFTCPKKYCIPFTFFGLSTLSIASTLSRSIFSPSFDTIYPNSLPLVTPNVHFLGFKDTPYSKALIKIFSKCPQ